MGQLDFSFVDTELFLVAGGIGVFMGLFSLPPGSAFADIFLLGGGIMAALGVTRLAIEKAL